MSVQEALELAASPLAREVLLALEPGDELRAWQEGPQEAAERCAVLR